MTDQTFLGTEPVGKLLKKLAIPAITAQLINMLYNLVDRVYIGHIPTTGALALTGVGVCMPVIMLVSAFAALVSMGGAPRASIAMGEGKREEAERLLGSCLTAQLVLSALLTAALLVWDRPLLLLFGASANTIGYAADYMNIYALGTVFVQVSLGMNAFVTAQGFAGVSMRTVLVGAVSNIILDPIFIFGLEMGVRGAALATILSQAISAVWVLCFLRGRRTLLRLRAATLRPDRRLLAGSMSLGLAPFIMQASESVIYVCFNASLLRYGGDIAVGAMTILTSVMQMTMLPLQGLAQGAQPISSYNFGARNAGRVRQVFLLLLKCCLIYSGAVWGAAMLFPRALAALFTDNAALIAFSARALRIYMAASLIFGIQIACQMTFISIGSARSSVAVAVMRKFVLLLPLIWLLPRLMSDRTTAVYLAEPMADLLAVSFTAILFAVQFRRALAALGQPDAPQKAVDGNRKRD